MPTTGAEMVPCRACGRLKRVDSWCVCPDAKAARRLEEQRREAEFFLAASGVDPDDLE